MTGKTKRTAIYTVYGILLIAIAVQGYAVLQEYIQRKSFTAVKTFDVAIEGNVRRPGHYRVPLGTTHFELLKVAGIKTTSNLSVFNLAAQVNPDQKITVDSLSSPVELKPNIYLEFFLGEVTIIDNNGTERIPVQGLPLNEGDRMLAEEKAQAEVSLGPASRVDMDNFSEITFDKIGSLKDKVKLTQLFQKNGVCEYKITYKTPDEQHRIVTPFGAVTVGSGGAEFSIEVKFNEAEINVKDGLILLERLDGSDAMNIIKGQAVKIYKENKPFEISRLGPEAAIADRFSQLMKAKTDRALQNMPFNFLFCSLPGVFYLISIQYDRNVVQVINIPSQTSVKTLVYGYSTLQEAFLYGNAVLAGTLVEHIFNTRISKYAVFDKNSIIKIASSIGGITVPVDGKAAAALHTKSGETKLAGQKLIDFLNPSVSGYFDSERRQVLVLKGIFEKLTSKNIVMSALLADQLLSNMEANITSTEVLKQYTSFVAKKNWSFKKNTLPVKVLKHGTTVVYEPLTDEAMKVLTQ